MYKFLKFIILALGLSFTLTASAGNFDAPVSPQWAADQTVVVEHLGYTSSYSLDLKAPQWVMWDITKEHLSNSVTSRSGYDFVPDPDIPDCPDTFAYSRSGYDRGHMCPAADMKWDTKAMEESFYLSNICLQDNTLNAGYWLVLEQKCRQFAYRYGSAQVVSGPLFYSDRQVKRYGKNKIAIPDAFFKAVLVKTSFSYQCFVWIVPNEPIDDTCPADRYQSTLDELKNRYSITLWPNNNKLDRKTKLRL